MENILEKIEQLTLSHDKIDPKIVRKKDIKLGLRNQDGSGVPVGITTKGRVLGYTKDASGVKPVEGKLYYCGYDVSEMINYYETTNSFGFEEVAYLLLTGELPSKTDLENFCYTLARRRSLTKTERRLIMEEVENNNQMYALHSLLSHISRNDKDADSTEIKDVSKQCINLIAKFPTIVANNYVFMKFNKGSDLRLRRNNIHFNYAEHFLYILKGRKPDPLEAHLFDLCLILHAEHGGGNNSTFTVRVVSSSGANTYMAIAAGLASLSGHLHGGANEAVVNMMKDLKKNVKDWGNEKELKKYLTDVLDKKAHDRTGKIYGLGHAVYTKSDPRALILRKQAEKLAKAKKMEREFQLYRTVDEIASSLLSERKGKDITVNVDFYSGLCYSMLGIPIELFTPIFSMARVVGWSAHRIEQILQGRIIRPAYISLPEDELTYLVMDKRS